ncbi:expressed unknown protein [Seminavis robusta]|uniref:DUF4116 domain-containing protein n=1 Tax=Seminavis robusta TaxID=568900 RepID=A0A9N8EWB6_9STRA|nr:expressed unknown protein [Seminavis robusta]|eukprot:Sro1882_g303360.1 n/a (798) ;mRNA; f:9389-11782
MASMQRQAIISRSSSSSNRDAMQIDSNSSNNDNTKKPAQETGTNKDYFERRFALDSVERDAARVWNTLPEAYRSDKDFVLAALKSESLPSKADFERTLPQSLRFDRDVVLAFCQRDDFSQLYYTRHLFVPDCLTGDKEVMMAYCSKIPRALQECSEELCNDRDVVMAAISLGGLELQYASRRLQEDKDLVIAACRKDGRALEFCPPGPTRTELTSDRDFMLSVLGKHGGAMLRLVPEPLKRDRLLLLEALAHGMRFRMVPDIYKNDKDFLLKALERSSKLYLEIGPLLKDPDYALAAATAPDSTDEVHRKALQAAPQLKQNREVIMSIALRGDKELLESLFNGGGAQQFLDDKPLMLAAVKRDCRLFKYARANLKEDPEVILASIQQDSAIDTLRDISPEVRRRFPEISVKAIQVTCVRRLRYLESLIPEPLWQNRDVVLAWIRKGGNVLESFERMLDRDQEMALEVAKHNWANFKKVGANLRGDKDFMALAVQQDGRVLRFASRQVQTNYQVVVRAVANHHRALSGVLVSESDFKNWVKSALDLHMTFVKDFLRGIAINKPHLPPARRSQLPMLDRGVETSQAFKQLIADFLGVPVKDDLRIMRQAWTNMTYPPCSSSTDASDRDDAAGMDDDVVNILGARRRERWERRMELQRADRDNAVAGRMERMGERFGRAAAFRDAQRRAAAPLFGRQEPDDVIDLDGDDDDDGDLIVDIAVNAGGPRVAAARRVRNPFPPPPAARVNQGRFVMGNNANGRANGAAADGNANGRAAAAANPPREIQFRENFFQMLEEWDDL